MGKQRQTYRIIPNIASNRLDIKIAGKIGQKDLGRIYTDLRFGIADLSPGFDVITDLQECTLMFLDGLDSLNKITNFIIRNKANFIVRIINKKQLISKQAMNLEAIKQGYKVIYVNDKDKAEQELENAKQRDGLRFSLFNHLVKYTIGDQAGTGTLLDISTSGCAITSATVVPKNEAHISIQVIFKPHPDFLENFQCSGQIVSSEKTSFTIKFNNLDESLRENLWNRLVYECE